MGGTIPELSMRCIFLWNFDVTTRSDLTLSEIFFLLKIKTCLYLCKLSRCIVMVSTVFSCKDSTMKTIDVLV